MFQPFWESFCTVQWLHNVVNCKFLECKWTSKISRVPQVWICPGITKDGMGELKSEIYQVVTVLRWSDNMGTFKRHLNKHSRSGRAIQTTCRQIRFSIDIVVSTDTVVKRYPSVWRRVSTLFLLSIDAASSAEFLQLFF